MTLVKAYLDPNWGPRRSQEFDSDHQFEAQLIPDPKRRVEHSLSPVGVPAVRRAKVDGDDDEVAVLRRLLLAAEVWSARWRNQLCRFPALVFVGAARVRRHEGRDFLGGGLDVVAGDGGGHGRHRLVGKDWPSGEDLASMLNLCGLRVGFLIFGFYCTSKNLLVKESLLVKVMQQVKKDLAKNVVMCN